MAVIQAQTLLRDWTTSSPRIQADDEHNPNPAHSQPRGNVNGNGNGHGSSNNNGNGGPSNGSGSGNGNHKASNNQSGIPVATFISNLILNHASEIGSRFTPKKSHQQQQQQRPQNDNDDTQNHPHSASVMDGGEFHVVDGELIQVVNAHSLQQNHDYYYHNDDDEYRPSYRRDRSRHFSPPSSSSSVSCMNSMHMHNEPIHQANHKLRKWIKNRRDKSGRNRRRHGHSHGHSHGGGGGAAAARSYSHQGSHRLKKSSGGGGRVSKKQQCQDCRTDFSLKGTNGGTHKVGRKYRKPHHSHRVVVPDPYTGTNTYRPHNNSNDGGGERGEEEERYYRHHHHHHHLELKEQQYVYDISAPTHQHMMRTATAYPVSYDFEEEEEEEPIVNANVNASDITTTTANSARSRPSVIPSNPPVSSSPPALLLQQSWEKINQLSSCLPQPLRKDKEEKEKKEDCPSTPTTPRSSTDTGLITTFQTLASSPSSFEQQDADLTFEHFLQDQQYILQSSPKEEQEEEKEEQGEENQEWTPVYFPSDKDDDDDDGEEVPMEQEETHTVNVQSMISTFEAQTTCTTRRLTAVTGVPPPPQLFHKSREEDERISESPEVVVPSSSSEQVSDSTTTSEPSAPSPQDSCNNELKILFVGSPQSGKTSLVQSLTGSKEDSTKRAGRRRPRGGANAAASNSMLDKKRQKLQQQGLNVSVAGEEKVLVNVNIQSWTPTSTAEFGRSIRYSLWDLPGSSLESGLHPSTQKIYFTPNSLYVVVWDMSAKNNPPFSYDQDVYSSDEEDFSDYEYEWYSDDDDSLEEYESRQEEAINRDIDENVLFWIDIISKQFAQGCAILPVVTHRDKFDNAQVERRTNLLRNRLERMAPSANIVFDSKGQIPRVSCLGDGEASELHNAILDVTSDSPLIEGHHSLKSHLETRIPRVTAIVQKVVMQLKAKGRTIEHIYDIHQEVCAEFGLKPPHSVEVFGLPEIIDALKFLSSTGSVMYFGRDDGNAVENDILSQAVILDPRWITSALSCILRTDLRRKLKQLKQDRGISCTRNEDIVEYHEAFQKKTSECAVVSHEDTALLWDSRSSMKKARETFHSNHDFALYHYLRQLCERHGVFVPLTINPKENAPTFYLLPSLFKKVPEEYWSYKPSHNHKTTLCQSWVFNDGQVPSGLIDLVNVAVLKGLFHKHSSRSDEYSYHAKVDEIRCWKTAFSARIVEFFSEQNSPRKSTNIITIYVRIVDKDSTQCVDSNEMVYGDKKLIVSATGNTGNEGETIWNLGYGEAIESVEGVIEENFADASRIEREVVCPDCLRYHEPKDVCTYCHESLMLDQCEPAICSRHGHRLNASLLLGLRGDVLEADSSSVSTSGITSIASMNSMFDSPAIKKAEELLGSVVLIGLWDRDTQEIKGLGSGFIADSKRGFVVTASHIFYDNPVGKTVGPVYYGLKNGKAVIGVIPKAGAKGENAGASFTYCADIIADDVNNTDACILRITSKFKRPIKADGIKLKKQPESILSQRDLIREGLQRLRCKGCSLDEYVRVLGFNQEGEGLVESGEHVEQMPGVTKGYVSKKLSSHSLRNLEVFMPNSEIVVICNTISGHSGGPCVNSSGEVIGIVSRADPVQKDRCYLVPSTQIKILLNKAKRRFETGGNHELMNLFNGC